MNRLQKEFIETQICREQLFLDKNDKRIVFTLNFLLLGNPELSGEPERAKQDDAACGRPCHDCQPSYHIMQQLLQQKNILRAFLRIHILSSLVHKYNISIRKNIISLLLRNYIFLNCIGLYLTCQGTDLHSPRNLAFANHGGVYSTLIKLGINQELLLKTDKKLHVRVLFF